ncbi:MAG: hypothetical protein K2G83_04915, partial [Ruminococcus sp.]|nr:hypothetical protein [Ruminococcus sp.]
IVFPNKDRYDELIKVGYWCFIGILKHRDFKDFLGICDHFDFYFLYDKFDFSKFNFHFILNLRDHVYKKLSENEIVKAKIIESVSISIQSGELHPKDETALKDILIKYFY